MWTEAELFQELMNIKQEKVRNIATMSHAVDDVGQGTIIDY